MSTLQNRFWAKVEKTDTCWLWRGALSSTQQPLFKAGPRTVSAHRWLWEEQFGPVAERFRLQHTCGNSQCVNPTHLQPMTRKQKHPRPVKPSMLNQFWTHVDKSGTCWVWTGCRDPRGYGRLWNSTAHIHTYAHRVSYELAHGPIPANLWVLHKCDNPPCCNPEHLFLGTPEDNAKDRDAKGRAAYQRRRAQK